MAAVLSIIFGNGTMRLENEQLADTRNSEVAAL